MPQTAFPRCNSLHCAPSSPCNQLDLCPLRLRFVLSDPRQACSGACWMCANCPPWLLPSRRLPTCNRHCYALGYWAAQHHVLMSDFDPIPISALFPTHAHVPRATPRSAEWPQNIPLNKETHALITAQLLEPDLHVDLRSPISLKDPGQAPPDETSAPASCQH